MPRTAGCWPGSALPAKPLSRREKAREREEGESRAGRETRGRVGGPEAAGAVAGRAGRGGRETRGRTGTRGPGPGSGGAGGAGAHSLAAQLHHLLDGGVAGRQEELRVLLHSEGLQPLGHRAERRALGAAGAGQPDGHPATADTGLRVSPPPPRLASSSGRRGRQVRKRSGRQRPGRSGAPRVPGSGRLLLPPAAAPAVSTEEPNVKRAGFSEPRSQPDHLPACKTPDCSCLFPHLQKGDNYRTISSAV